MKLSARQKKSGGLALVALVGWASGVWLPPEVAGELVGGVMGLF